jgi:hypothetical protein
MVRLVKALFLLHKDFSSLIERLFLGNCRLFLNDEENRAACLLLSNQHLSMFGQLPCEQLHFLQV